MIARMELGFFIEDCLSDLDFQIKVGFSNVAILRGLVQKLHSLDVNDFQMKRELIENAIPPSLINPKGILDDQDFEVALFRSGKEMFN